jgi:hypothetical protein
VQTVERLFASCTHRHACVVQSAARQQQLSPKAAIRHEWQVSLEARIVAKRDIGRIGVLDVQDDEVPLAHVMDAVQDAKQRVRCHSSSCDST